MAAEDRIAMFQERLRRLYKFPKTDQATLEERLSDIEKAVTHLMVTQTMQALEAYRERPPDLSVLDVLGANEKAVSDIEQKRGYWTPGDEIVP